MPKTLVLFYTPHIIAGGRGKGLSPEKGFLPVEKTLVPSISGEFSHVNNFFSYTFHCYSIVTATVHFLISLLFPVNCSYLNLVSLLFVRPVGEGRGYMVLVGVLPWRIQLMNHDNNVRRNQNVSKVMPCLKKTQQIQCF